MSIRSPLRVLLVLIVLVEGVLPVGLVLLRNRFLFFPSAGAAEEGLGAFAGLDARVVRVHRADGRALSAYDVTPRDVDPERPTVLYFHGNAGNVAMRASSAARFARGTRCRVLFLDYSGYGGNEGSPSEEELERDAIAAYDHAIAAGVLPSRLVVLGESIGGGPALAVASARDVAGVVLHSTFASLSSMARHAFPWAPLVPLLVSGSFRNADRVARLACPVLVVHGTRDRVVPVDEGRALRDAAPARAELLEIEGAGHDDLVDVAGGAYLHDLGERCRRWSRERETKR